MDTKHECIIDDVGRECSKCHTYKKWEEFHKCKNAKYGRRSYCKECHIIMNRQYIENNKEYVSDYHKKYRGSRKKEIHEYLRKYYLENREKLIINNNLRAKVNKDRDEARRNAYLKAYRKAPALYSTYGAQLCIYNDVREGDNGYLIVSCTYCGKSYYPTNSELWSRLSSIYGRQAGEGNLYCSDSCKQACPTYKQIKYRKDQKPNIAYETLDPYVRQEVFKRDNYLCQKCGKSNNKSTNPLHCHHINPNKESPMEANDMDNLITLCKKCHIKVHQDIEGCGFRELADCSK